MPLDRPNPAGWEETTPRVLLIDDDAGDQLLVRRAFSGDAVEPDLLVIDEGDRALEYLARCADACRNGTLHRPDLVLLDLNLPGARGAKILEAVRREERLRSTPVVVFSTSSRDADLEEAYRLGCNAYVVKPDSAATFIHTVRVVCEFWLEIAALPRR